MRSRVNTMARSAAQESMIIEINDPLTPAKTINLIFPAQKLPQNAYSSPLAKCQSPPR
ncbi:hypothetical protein MTo_02318 [Microcystis aeruginosa NIES-1211]|jgi:hypothetical protein|uniref:Uncharacterized protein n=1 Tax=Microcystis aeruginosa NIES-2519 TaxID=2303981 RepID=A0A5A5QZQ3_MICAE|nr:hypothetical protein [Microcystis aeruginosa]GBL15009.1 hypothetical protein MTo_02318 [Microcystis aeruginosa NIES-1211]GCA68724.1 hypothetical protein MiYa_00240 [Microcystis aeruginosa NIES-2519]GCA82319.1 hypothetical protein MiHa_00269 [Microcystis aeruginosa NIES-2522]GCA87837.1 hypothetical protein MiTa_01176 [Microcystis aeruginosa NIES-4264]